MRTPDPSAVAIEPGERQQQLERGRRGLAPAAGLRVSRPGVSGMGKRGERGASPPAPSPLCQTMPQPECAVKKNVPVLFKIPESDTDSVACAGAAAPSPSRQCPRKAHERAHRHAERPFDVFVAPPRSGRSITKQAATTSAPIFFESARPRPRRAAGGDQVVHEDHLSPAIAHPRDLDLVEAVFQRIVVEPWCAAACLLADRHEAGRS